MLNVNLNGVASVKAEFRMSQEKKHFYATNVVYFKTLIWINTFVTIVSMDYR